MSSFSSSSKSGDFCPKRGSWSGIASLGRRQKQALPQQLPLLGQKPPLLEELEKLDINSLTPLEAITKLYELQQKAREG